MKIIYFLKNGIATPEDKAHQQRLRIDGHKVTFSNGSVKHGFQDSCDAVYLAGDFDHVETWAESKGIEVIKPEPEPEPVDEPEKPKRRGRKPVVTDEPEAPEAETE